jgi:hypothetical protein
MAASCGRSEFHILRSIDTKILEGLASAYYNDITGLHMVSLEFHKDLAKSTDDLRSPCRVVLSTLDVLPA